jgi:hypothetical protein
MAIRGTAAIETNHVAPLEPVFLSMLPIYRPLRAHQREAEHRASWHIYLGGALVVLTMGRQASRLLITGQ